MLLVCLDTPFSWLPNEEGGAKKHRADCSWMVRYVERPCALVSSYSPSTARTHNNNYSASLHSGTCPASYLENPSSACPSQLEAQDMWTETETTEVVPISFPILSYSISGLCPAGRLGVQLLTQPLAKRLLTQIKFQKSSSKTGVIH